MSTTTRVLVVEDASVVARGIVGLLDEAGGVEVVGVVGDGRSAIEGFNAAQPDCVILDLQLPGVSGFEVLDHIRSTGRPCTVIVLTSHLEPSIRERCLAAGADHFLGKPGDIQRLVEIVAAQSTGSLSAKG